MVIIEFEYWSRTGGFGYADVVKFVDGRLERTSKCGWPEPRPWSRADWQQTGRQQWQQVHPLTKESFRKQQPRKKWQLFRRLWLLFFRLIWLQRWLFGGVRAQSGQSWRGPEELRPRPTTKNWRKQGVWNIRHEWQRRLLRWDFSNANEVIDKALQSCHLPTEQDSDANAMRGKASRSV